MAALIVLQIHFSDKIIISIHQAGFTELRLSEEYIKIL